MAAAEFYARFEQRYEPGIGRALIAGLVYLAVAWFRRRQAGNDTPRPAYAYATPGNEPPVNTTERRAVMDVAPLDIATGKTGGAPSGGLRNDDIGLTDKDAPQDCRGLRYINSSRKAAVRRPGNQGLPVVSRAHCARGPNMGKAAGS